MVPISLRCDIQLVMLVDWLEWRVEGGQCKGEVGAGVRRMLGDAVCFSLVLRLVVQHWRFLCGFIMIYFNVVIVRDGWRGGESKGGMYLQFGG